MERTDPVNPSIPTGPTSVDPPPPRAFAQGTGVLLQTVGVLLFLTNCCICSTAFLWEPRLSTLEVLDHARRQGVETSSLQDPAKLGLMLTVMFSGVGGLALAACGLGLQSERSRAAWGAFTAVLALTLVLVVGGVALWIGHAGVAAKLWNAGLIFIAVVLLGFTGVALRQVTANPPPRDVDIIPVGAKIPYSFYHDDPPEVRLAKELANRRAKLEAEGRQLDRMERELDEGKE